MFVSFCDRTKGSRAEETGCLDDSLHVVTSVSHLILRQYVLKSDFIYMVAAFLDQRSDSLKAQET